MKERIPVAKMHCYQLITLCSVCLVTTAWAVRAEDNTELRTIDYLVPHTSTVSANAGRHVELFVREKVLRSNSSQTRPVVLFIHGATTSVVPNFDLQFQNYSWMEYLAKAGFDVFALDLTGYGLSPRPMMDNSCNASTAQQKQYLIPNPLPDTCTAAYPYALTTLQSDWDEIDTVVDYLRDFRNVDKISIVAWSRGGARGAGYSTLHPEKIDRLFLQAPGRYFPYSPDGPPVLPVAGNPYSVLGKADFFTSWDNQLGCVNQFTPEIRDPIAAAMLDSDPLASTWGTDGAVRSPVWNSPPGSLYWGWNTSIVGQVQAPTLVIRGDTDATVPLGDIQAFLRDLVSVRQKVYVHVACASHYLHLENQHEILLRASLEWLQKGTFNGQSNGNFAVDASGQIRPEP